MRKIYRFMLTESDENLLKSGLMSSVLIIIRLWNLGPKQAVDRILYWFNMNSTLSW